MGGEFKDIVIFLPGIGGSNLVRKGQILWGASWQVVFSAFTQGRLDELALPDGAQDVDDEIVATDVLDTFHVIPGLWKIEGYHRFCQQLCATVGLIRGRNFFEFPYDWRRDNRLSAKKLAGFAAEKLRAWRVASNNENARIILIGHSMGGLVARYYVECLEGWKDVARLYTLGTPHRGSLNALGYLTNGFAKGIGPLSVDATGPLRSFASVYQLLPTYPCIAGAHGMQRVNETQLDMLDPGSVANGFAFHREIAEAVESNRLLEGYPLGYIMPIAATRQPTFQSARIDDAKVMLLKEFEGQDHGGDGTVPRVSAVPLEMSLDQAMNVWGLHSALCNEKGVDEHMIATLRARRLDEDKFRLESGKPEVRFSLDDVCEADKPLTLSATVHGVHEQTLAVTTMSDDGAVGPSSTLHRSGEALVGDLLLPPGPWKVTVTGRKSLGVSDLILAI